MLRTEMPAGWTDKKMPNGWIRRVVQPADIKVKRLEQENKLLHDAIKSLEDKLNLLLGEPRGGN